MNSRNVRRRRPSRRLEALESRRVLAAQPIITEFMASNRDTLLDASTPPESPDWIEIFNEGDTDTNLDGWYLTDDADDLTKWKFPSMDLPSGTFDIVFASGKNQPDAGGNLHTNFRLSASGEFLALVRPDGQTIASQFGSGESPYPRQVPDVSYGRVMSPVSRTLLDSANKSEARLLVPSPEYDGRWTDTTFDDDPANTEWTDVLMPVGYSDDEILSNLVATDVSAAMKSVNSSALLRSRFHVSEVGGYDELSLNVAYDDGFAAFLNGQLIARNNAPEVLTFDAFATEEHDAIGETFRVDPANRSVLYDFEEDGGQSVSDKLVGDGTQNPQFNSGGSIDSNSGRAAFGSRSLRLPSSPGPPEIFNRLRIPDTAELGERFTLAVQVDFSTHQFQRLFTNYQGTGAIGPERLLFDVDPSGSAIPGVRFGIGNRGTLQTESVPAQLLAEGYHHFAVTYDDGDVQVYLNGELILTGTLGSGPLSMPLDLFFGEDPHDGGGTANEQLAGNVDDLLVLSGSVLSASDVGLLAREGSTALFASGGRDPLFQSFDITDHLDLLVPGGNVLAIQAMNVSAGDNDFFMLPELVAGILPNHHPPSYLEAATPGAINVAPLRGLVGDVNFDVERGFYDKPVAVNVSVETRGATISYTTDGSAPSLTNGTIVAAPNAQSAPAVQLNIDTTTTLTVGAFKEDFRPADLVSHTYIYLHDVIRQPKQPEGLPNRWGPTRADYEMDPEIVDVAPYSETILDDLKSIPTVSLVVDPEHFFNRDGIYSNTLARGRAWERPVSFEYIDPLHDERIQVNAGLRIHGGFSRDPSASPQHSLRLHFRSEYGPGKLRIPLFPDSDVTEFDSLVLNAQSSDNWSSINTTTGRVAQFMRDQWAQDMQREMGHVHVPGKYVHVYINGLYWGLYGLMERPDDDFAAAHLGGSDEEYDVIVDENANSGNLTAWREVLERARAEDLAGVEELLDIDNFIDYMILNIYMGNWDWPDHNWNAARRRVDGERFTFFIWDAEVGLGLDVNVPGPIRPRTIDVDLAGRRRDLGSADVRNGPGEIYDRLRTLPEFQIRFADRLHQHLFNNGALTPDRAASVYAARANEIESALVGQSARWGDVRRRIPDVPDGVWTEEKQWILETFFPQRGTIVLEDFREESLYPSIAAPAFLQHGGGVDSGFQLTMTNDHDTGVILYTLDGSDPRLLGGERSPSAVTYESAVEISSETTVQARVYDNGEWSALNAATFVIRTSPGDLNADGQVDAADVRVLCNAIRFGEDHFDLNSDHVADTSDMVVMIEEFLGSAIGDSNFDGIFNSTDLILVFMAAEYEDRIAGNSTWETGDWNCDGEFNTNDFVFAFQQNGYQRNSTSRREISSVRPRSGLDPVRVSLAEQ